MKQFLNLKTRTYKSKEYNMYLDSLDENDNLDEADAWKRDIKPEQDIPIAKPAQVRVDPNTIIALIENCSLEAFHENPDDPKYDSTDVYLNSGLMITAIGTIKDIEKQIEKINSMT